MEKELEDACIKLAAVVSGLQGKSATAMLRGIVGREDDPAVLAGLAQGKLRSRLDELTDALTGRVNDHHRFMIDFRLRRIQQATADIDALDREVDALMEAEGWTSARDLLVSIPGIGPRGAEELIAEIGVDMNVFPTPAALASWAGVAPGSYQSAGTNKRVATPPGNHYIKRTLGIAAIAAVRKKGSFLNIRFKRLTARLGYSRALVVTERSMITSIWHKFTTGEFYYDLGDTYYARPANAASVRRKIRDLDTAGYTVTPAA
ncbi:IS110 family transposase [Brooklawnia propionicigenes]|uniref:IS110 family transposase n=1 Tax=Brooklawnia propionicigenes TaxID=3041175 RepID=A0AAN0MI00_9ACTN|nr:transposase [Brooklawnia sp. SH051]BEH02786.1 IS110 family transposase [Brooklawnia sp. SH051]